MSSPVLSKSSRTLHEAHDGQTSKDSSLRTTLSTVVVSFFPRYHNPWLLVLHRCEWDQRTLENSRVSFCVALLPSLSPSPEWPYFVLRRIRSLSRIPVTTSTLIHSTSPIRNKTPRSPDPSPVPFLHSNGNVFGTCHRIVVSLSQTLSPYGPVDGSNRTRDVNE